MRYYSDLTKKFYDEVEECAKAEELFRAEQAKKEAEALEKSNARKEAAKKVEEAYNKLTLARKEYQKILSDFCKDYDYYHVSLDKNDVADWVDSFVVLDDRYGDLLKRWF